MNRKKTRRIRWRATLKRMNMEEIWNTTGTDMTRAWSMRWTSPLLGREETITVVLQYRGDRLVHMSKEELQHEIAALREELNELRRLVAQL